MIYPMVKHSDWETNPKVKKILKLKLAVNEMERDVARLDRQIEEQQQTIENGERNATCGPRSGVSMR